MKKVAVCLAMIICTSFLRAQVIEGTWSGTAEVDAMRLQLVFHIGTEGGTMDSPDQGAMGIPLSRATFARDTLRVEVAAIGLFYTGILSDGGFKGAFTQRGMSFPLDLARGDVAPPRRPQEPHAPFPYRVEEVTFENTVAGIRFAGTLTMPTEGSGFPAVVLLTGSGAQNRDEELFGHKPFFVLADHLTRRGIAVLRFDDRGVGGSEAGADPVAATTADFATDAAAALDYLRTRPEINASKAGIAGHSEGGLVAFMTAADHPDEVAFVVSMAGPGVNGEEISVMQYVDMARANGAPVDALPAVAEKQRRDLALIFDNTPEFVEANLDSIASSVVPEYALMDTATQNRVRAQIRASNTPWLRFFAAHDPASDLSRVVCSVLAVNGAKDVQVRSSVNLAAIAAALREAGNARVETIEYPGLNHLFQTAETGAITEYSRIEDTFSVQTMNDIAAWILKVTK